MTLQENKPSPLADSSERCLYLGLRDDLDTALGFPSNWNCCHNAKPIATPNHEHQQNVCLTSKYTECLVFLTEKKKKIPKDLRMPKLRERRKAIGIWLLLMVVLVSVIAGSLIFSGYWKPPLVENLSVPEQIDKVETAINTPFIETDIPEILDTPVAPTEVFISATQTKSISTDYCAYPLETPIGASGQFIIIQVAYGESMSILTKRYRTTAEAIDAVNYFLPSPLWAEQVIVIPVNTTEIDSLLPLKPVLVAEDDTSLATLAQNLSVSLSDLKKINQMSPFCRSFHGWVLIPAEKKTP